MGAQILEKISFKRKIALIFKLKTNIKSKKSYCSRKCLEEAGLLKVPEDGAGTSIRLPSFKRRDTDRNFFVRWMLVGNEKRKQGLEGWQPLCGKSLRELQSIDLRF